MPFEANENCSQTSNLMLLHIYKATLFQNNNGTRTDDQAIELCTGLSLNICKVGKIQRAQYLDWQAMFHQIKCEHCLRFYTTTISHFITMNLSAMKTSLSRLRINAELDLLWHRPNPFTCIKLNSTQPKTGADAKHGSTNRKNVNHIAHPPINLVSNERIEAGTDGHGKALPVAYESHE